MGRPRKSSTSTVATVDAELIPYDSETAVMAAPGPDDSDWDITHVLENVAVYSKHGRMANLLNVAFDGPFTVRGMVRVEKERKWRFLKTSPKMQHISITGCTRFSVGLGEDGRSPGIWAGGKCGWYEIRPPMPAYRPIFEKMNQGVSLYYMMHEVHVEYEEVERTRWAKEAQKQKPKPKKPSRYDIFTTLNEDIMFLKYAVLVGDGSFRDEVIAACDEHAPFIISQFFADERLPKKERLDWPPTTFYRWLTARHPSIVLKMRNAELGKKPEGNAAEVSDDPPSTKALAAIQAPPHTVVEPPALVDTVLPDAGGVQAKDFVAPRRSMRRSGSIEQQQLRYSPKASSVQASSVQASSPPDSSAVDHIDHPMDEILETTETTPFEDLPAATEDSIMEDAHGQTTVQLLHDAVNEVLAGFTKPIGKLTYAWIRSHLYYKYKMRKYDTPNEILTRYAAELYPILDRSVWGGSQFFKTLGILAAQSPPDTEVLAEDEVRYCLQKRATAPAPRIQKVIPPKTIETPDRKHARVQGGKTSGLRPSFKRNLSDADTESNPRGSKAMKQFHSVGDPIHEDDDSDVVYDSSDADDDTAETPIPLKLVLEAEKLPDFTPKGPNGAWVCDKTDQCVFVERNPQDADGQARIKQHIEDEHEGHHQTERINLAMMEAGRGHLPIDNLLEKIRKLGAKVDKAEEVLVNDNLMKKPVKRRLLI